MLVNQLKPIRSRSEGHLRLFIYVADMEVVPSSVYSLFHLFVFQRLASFPALNATFFFGLISKYEKISPAGYEVGQTVSS